MYDLHDIYAQAAEKIKLFDIFVQTHGLTDKIQADHIGYKCSTSAHFHELRELFETHSDFIYQSIISERRIAIIKLRKPFHTSCGVINFLELSDQKPDGSQKDGFDHLEFYPVKKSIEELVDYLTDKKVDIHRVVRPHHTTFDISIEDIFIARIESERLIEKIIRDEILTQ